MPIFGGDTTTNSPDRMGMKQKIDQNLLNQLEQLCDACPNGAYLQGCPFRLLNTLSRASRVSLLKSMTVEQVQGLFDLVDGCACPVRVQLKEALKQIELGEVNTKP